MEEELPRAAGGHHPICSMNLVCAEGGVSRSAERAQRYAALDPRHLLKKVDENFSQKSFLLVLVLCLCR